MDLDGNVTEVVIEDGTVDSYATEKARIGEDRLSTSIQEAVV